MNQIFGDYNPQNQSNKNTKEKNQNNYNELNSNFNSFDNNLNNNYNNLNNNFNSINNGFDNNFNGLNNGFDNNLNNSINQNYNYYQNANAFDDINNHLNYYQTEDMERLKLKQIIKVFCIIAICFGILIVGKSTYALTFGRPKPKDNVQVSTDKMGKEVTITISSSLPVKEYSYRWNEGTDMKKQGNGTVTITETVDIPNGNNILKLTVIDNYGNRTEYQKQYIYESSDIQKPSIKFEIVGTKLKITASDDQKIKYMTYQWSDEEPVRIDAKEDNQKEIVEEIEVSRGKDKLTIIAVDGEDNKETVSKTIIGSKKPTFTLETEGTDLVIKAQDDEGIKTIKASVDGNETVANDINQKEIDAKLSLESGTHKISVTVINNDNQELTKELEVNM